MALRVPAGRAGRPWLARRIEVAQRGARVLDEKRAALLRERAGLRERVAAAELAWQAAADEAARSLRRAAILAGERPLQFARLYAREPARVEIAWRSTLGVVHPVEARVTSPPPLDVAGLGGTSALVQVAGAHRRALQAGARYAAGRMAVEQLDAELARTVRRLRAIECRWLPEHGQALAALELAFDEAERDEAARTRWARGRPARGPSPTRR